MVGSAGRMVFNPAAPELNVVPPIFCRTVFFGGNPEPVAARSAFCILGECTVTLWNAFASPKNAHTAKIDFIATRQQTSLIDSM